MDHSEAKYGTLAARYMAGELTTTEREDFEQHYFECVECADSVRAMVRTTSFATAAEPPRLTVGTAPQSRAFGRWFDGLRAWQPMAALATACIALVFASFDALGTRSGSPQPVIAYHLIPDASRGAEPPVDRTAGPFVVLSADVPETVQEWKWQIRSADGGGPVFEGVAKTPPGGTLTLLAPTSQLPPGRNTLLLSDTSSVIPEIAYSFRMH